MSTIERAADLLRSLSLGQQKPAPVGERHAPEPDAIERMAERLDAKGKPATPGGAKSRTFKIDRNRLRAQSLITPDGERSAVAESFRRIKRQILANIANAKAGAAPANLVMMTSALAGEGKTFCAINLAISLALEVDRTVLLVDADVAKANVPRVLGLEADRGLMEVLLDRNVHLTDVLWKADIGKLAVLPVGGAHKHATELLGSEAMRGLLREMAERYRDRIIIFDSPPLLAASEAGALASQMGQIVMVVEAAKTSEAQIKEALGRIDAGRVAGLLLNKADGFSLEYGYGGYG